MYLIRYALINVQAKTCPYTWVVPFQINQISKTTPAQIIVFLQMYLFIYSGKKIDMNSDESKIFNVMDEYLLSNALFCRGGSK